MSVISMVKSLIRNKLVSIKHLLYSWLYMYVCSQWHGQGTVGSPKVEIKRFHL